VKDPEHGNYPEATFFEEKSQMIIMAYRPKKERPRIWRIRTGTRNITPDHTEVNFSRYQDFKHFHTHSLKSRKVRRVDASTL